MTKSSGDKHTETSDPHWVEWATGGACTMLVIAIFIWIAWDIYRYQPSDPSFQINIQSTSSSIDGYRVKFEVVNTSLTTASQVHIRGDIFRNSAILESSDLTFDYIGAEANETGVVFFRVNPAENTLDLKVVGYVEP
jgi:uncharacterized protein (TIGR02588 family)